MRTEGPYRIIKLADGNEISCHALMIATGVQWRRLEAPGIDRLQGAGVYYGGGATEALSCKGETVYVVGGANSAGQAAMNFSKYAERVVILVRGGLLASTMSQYLIDQIKATPNIELWAHASVAEAHGEKHLEEISVLCSDTNKAERVPASAMFIFIGALPQTDWLAGIVERDERGFMLTGPDSMNGVRPKGWDAGPRRLPARNQHSRYFCRRRCTPRFSETGGFRCRRRLRRGAVHSSVLEQGIAGTWWKNRNFFGARIRGPAGRSDRLVHQPVTGTRTQGGRNVRTPRRSCGCNVCGSKTGNFRSEGNLVGEPVDNCQSSQAPLPDCFRSPG